MQKAISTSAGTGQKTQLLVGKGHPRQQEKLGPVPIPAVQLGPPPQVALPRGQDRVTSPTELQAKISLLHKILGRPKIGVGVEGLLQGHTDNLEPSHFVLTHF